MQLIHLKSTESTNSWVVNNEETLTSPVMVWCDFQTAGRGQRGNKWESEPYCNITASIFFKPIDFPAARQFALSEAVALAIVDFLAELGVEAKVKWPNDIYVGDKKICGILMEHSVMGKNISRTIAGFGLNINQTVFLSDAPNPVSLKTLTGESYDLPVLIEKLQIRLHNVVENLPDTDLEDLHRRFMDKLWRNDGKLYNFIDKREDKGIKARIKDVAPQGIITITTDSGIDKNYAFKEIEFIL